MQYAQGDQQPASHLPRLPQPTEMTMSIMYSPLPFIPTFIGKSFEHEGGMSLYSLISTTAPKIYTVMKN